MEKVLPFVSSPAKEFADESDEDLLFYIALKGEDYISAKKAWCEFYCRHAQYLYGVFYKRYKSVLGGGIGVEDLVQDTFNRVFDRAHRFKKSGAIDFAEQRRWVRAWLGRIALNLLRDQFRRYLGKMIPYDPVEVLSKAEMTDEDNGASECLPEMNQERLNIFNEALGSLSERERDVLLVTYEFFQADKEHQRLPNTAAADLAGKWNTTSDNVRAIRMRAHKKLKKLVEYRTLPKQNN